MNELTRTALQSHIHKAIDPTLILTTRQKEHLNSILNAQGIDSTQVLATGQTAFQYLEVGVLGILDDLEDIYPPEKRT